MKKGQVQKWALALTSYDKETMVEMLDNGWNINYVFGDILRGFTSLHFVILISANLFRAIPPDRDKTINTVRFLLDNHADPNFGIEHIGLVYQNHSLATPYQGYTPVTMASVLDAPYEILDALLHKGGRLDDVNLTTRPSIDTVRTYLIAGGDVNKVPIWYTQAAYGVDMEMSYKQAVLLDAFGYKQFENGNSISRFAYKLFSFRPQWHSNESKETAIKGFLFVLRRVYFKLDASVGHIPPKFLKYVFFCEWMTAHSKWFSLDTSRHIALCLLKTLNRLLTRIIQ